jgi:hypothetical protein
MTDRGSGSTPGRGITEDDMDRIQRFLATGRSRRSPDMLLPEGSADRGPELEGLGPEESETGDRGETTS